MTLGRSNLFSEIKHYQELSRDLQAHLSKYPNDWLKYQEEFNSTVENITNDILQFEKENIEKSETKVYKLKNIFEKRYRKCFLYGEYPRWVYNKPYGYAGDFKIIDNIYQNSPHTTGFDRLWDNYFLQMTASKATRERKEIMKESIVEFVSDNIGPTVDIMNLASGACREIKELLDGDSNNIFSQVKVDCYDFDASAIAYASQLLNNDPKVNFYLKNALRLALRKDISNEISKSYDFIYSIGLFDYFDETVAIRLISNLRKILKKNGIMIIANFGEKYRNSSAGLMEWATEWYLIYRTEEELRKIFLDSGFDNKSLYIFATQGSVIQFCCVKK